MNEKEIFDLINRGVVSLDALKSAIDMAEMRLNKKEAREKSNITFPHKTTVYVHSDDDSVFAQMRDEGFSEAQIAEWSLDFIGCEVGLMVEIAEDGKVTFLGIKGNIV